VLRSALREWLGRFEARVEVGVWINAQVSAQVSVQLGDQVTFRTRRTRQDLRAVAKTGSTKLKHGGTNLRRRHRKVREPNASTTWRNQRRRLECPVALP
jgi:hypothetical protein